MGVFGVEALPQSRGTAAGEITVGGMSLLHGHPPGQIGIAVLRQHVEDHPTAQDTQIHTVAALGIARVTLPERRQRVQTLTRHGVPLTIALTRFTLGFQVLLERL